MTYAGELRVDGQVFTGGPLDSAAIIVPIPR
jgi:hypothetical protein